MPAAVRAGETRAVAMGTGMSSLRASSRAAVVVLLCISCASILAQTGRGPTKSPRRTIVDLNADELRRQYREELGRLEFADDPQELRILLGKTGGNVEGFFNDIQNTASKEQILSQRLKFAGQVEASSSSSYNYLLLARPDRVGFVFEEDRADDKNRPVILRRLSDYIVTSGFASQCVFLHPSHQYGSRFRYVGKLPSAQVIVFAQKPEVGDYVNYINETPVLLQGLVWIDPATYQIVRMRTDLLEPDNRNFVTRRTTESWFSEVRFDGVPQAFWLPRRVVVTTEYAGQIYRNEHVYSGYRLFSVSSFDKIVKP